MKLTPLDIRKQEFNKAFRGYDADEVRAFLETLSNQWQELQTERRHLEERLQQESRRADERIQDAELRLQDQISTLEMKVRHYEKIEEALEEALKTGRETARQTIAQAERTAQHLVEDAENEALRLKKQAEAERYELKREVAKIGGRRKEIVARLRAFLMSEMEVLAHFDGDEPMGFIKLLPAEERQLTAPPEPPMPLPSITEGADLSDGEEDPQPMFDQPRYASEDALPDPPATPEPTWSVPVAAEPPQGRASDGEMTAGVPENAGEEEPVLPEDTEDDWDQAAEAVLAEVLGEQEAAVSDDFSAGSFESEEVADVQATTSPVENIPTQDVFREVFDDGRGAANAPPYAPSEQPPFRPTEDESPPSRLRDFLDREFSETRTPQAEASEPEASTADSGGMWDFAGETQPASQSEAVDSLAAQPEEEVAQAEEVPAEKAPPEQAAPQTPPPTLLEGPGWVARPVISPFTTNNVGRDESVLGSSDELEKIRRILDGLE